MLQKSITFLTTAITLLISQGNCATILPDAEELDKVRVAHSGATQQILDEAERVLRVIADHPEDFHKWSHRQESASADVSNPAFDSIIGAFNRLAHTVAANPNEFRKYLRRQAAAATGATPDDDGLSDDYYEFVNAAAPTPIIYKLVVRTADANQIYGELDIPFTPTQTASIGTATRVHGFLKGAFEYATGSIGSIQPWTTKENFEEAIDLRALAKIGMQIMNGQPVIVNLFEELSEASWHRTFRADLSRPNFGDETKNRRRAALSQLICLAHAENSQTTTLTKRQQEICYTLALQYARNSCVDNAGGTRDDFAIIGANTITIHGAPESRRTPLPLFPNGETSWIFRKPQ